MIQAIETEYNGNKYRSRLEARWAVFFDSLNIEYTYEPEGFDLQEAGRYLPDFFIQYHEDYNDKIGGHWIEIKPIAPDIQEIKKMAALSKESKFSGNILIGKPGRHNIVRTFPHAVCTLYHNNREIDYGFEVIKEEMTQAGYEVYRYRFDFETKQTPYEIRDICLLLHQFIPASHKEFLFKACKNANFARFEHGECPNINEKGDMV